MRPITVPGRRRTRYSQLPVTSFVIKRKRDNDQDNRATSTANPDATVKPAQFQAAGPQVAYYDICGGKNTSKHPPKPAPAKTLTDANAQQLYKVTIAAVDTGVTLMVTDIYEMNQDHRLHSGMQTMRYGDGNLVTGRMGMTYLIEVGLTWCSQPQLTALPGVNAQG
jgi:hypothetical protein